MPQSNITRREALLVGAAIASSALAACSGDAGGDVVATSDDGAPDLLVASLDPKSTADWDAQYYQPAYDSPAEAAEAARAVAEEVEEGGIVLLKNDGTLPLPAGAAVSLLGRSSVDTLYGGLGAGAVPADTPCTSIYDGLVAAGLVPDPAMRDWIVTHAANYPRTSVTTMDLRDVTTFYIGEIPWEDYPEELKARLAGTPAVVVIGRESGESFDLSRDLGQELADPRYESFVPNRETARYQPGQHSLQLSAEERDLIAAAKASCASVTVLVNSGTPLELGELVEPGGPLEVNAILHVGFPGAVGANAIGRVLTGVVDPSGRTCDTWARDALANPTTGSLGEHPYTDVSGFYPGNADMGDGAYFCEYREGIYMGYRWYETAGETGAIDYDQAVVWPFGFGLSYTTFSRELQDVTLASDKDSVTARVRVTNTGDRAGRDVAEVYTSSPWFEGGLEVPACRLAAFAKTGELAPGASAELELTWPVVDMASWDVRTGTWELAAGAHVVSLRSDAHTVVDSRELELEARSWTEDPATGAALANRFPDLDEYLKANCQPLATRTDLAGTFPAVPDARTAAEVGLDLQQYDATAHEDPASTMPTTGADGIVNLIDLRGRSLDDPLWDLLLDRLTMGEMVNACCVDPSAAIDSIGKPAWRWTDSPAGLETPTDGVPHCAWPSEYLVGQTWDADLVRRMGEAVGEEALVSGYFAWYAPAMNLHRSPFSARNYEYYSEDPQLTGVLGAALAAGCASRGVVSMCKHLGVYDQDSCRRQHVLNWCGEQAVREIYVRPFELVVKSAAAREVPMIDASTGERITATLPLLAIMSSYNFLGATWAGGRPELQTDLLRGEWGFGGVVESDFSVDDYYMDHDQAIAAGTDIQLCTPATGTFANLRSATTVRAMRRAMRRYLYVVVNSCAMNGIVPTVRVEE